MKIEGSGCLWKLTDLHERLFIHQDKSSIYTDHLPSINTEQTLRKIIGVSHSLSCQVILDSFPGKCDEKYRAQVIWT